jgi:hypothetical protein
MSEQNEIERELIRIMREPKIDDSNRWIHLTLAQWNELLKWQQRLADAEKALEFYADDLNWGSREYEIVDIEIDESDLSDFCGSISGGKRAREYFEKWRTSAEGEKR